MKVKKLKEILDVVDDEANVEIVTYDGSCYYGGNIIILRLLIETNIENKDMALKIVIEE